MKTFNDTNQGTYVTPQVVNVTLMVEQCIASSCGVALENMEGNKIFDEEF